MNNKISNPLLKQIISEIAYNANQGRITNLKWKTSLKEAAGSPKDKKQEPTDDLPPLGDEEKNTPNDVAPKDQKPDAAPSEKAPTEQPAPEAPSQDSQEEDPAKAQADASKKKAELEKAKAEKDQAEEELKKQSYVKLKSSGGLHFMLGKILNHAFRTNTIDALASEMAQKLKITTTDDVASFEEDMALYRNIPGMADLLSAIKTMATKNPEASAEEEQTP